MVLNHDNLERLQNKFYLFHGGGFFDNLMFSMVSDFDLLTIKRTDLANLSKV